MKKTTKRTGLLFGFFVIVLIGCILWFFNVAEDYYALTARTLENAASVAPLNKESILVTQKPRNEKFNVEVKYRTFFLTVPSASQVELVADFNRFGKDPIILKPYKKGYFETSVALTSGEYKYYFKVDGEKMLDPTNMDRQIFNGEEVCIKTVR